VLGWGGGGVDTMTSLGPYELNTIVTGECSALMAALPDDCIDMWLTSPPYDSLRSYSGYTFDFEAIAAQLWRVMKPGGVGVWVVADETKDGSESGTSFRQALGFMALGFRLHDTMIYKVNGTGAKGSNKSYWQAFEYMFVFSKGEPKTVSRIADKRRADNRKKNTYSGRTDDRGNRNKFNRVDCDSILIRDNVWEYSTGFMSGSKDEIAYDHPAIFPEALARDHILSWSMPGDVVLDPMIGSGTVAKQAHLLGRRYLGFEISEEYCDLSRRRLANVEAQLFLMPPAVEANGTSASQSPLGKPEQAAMFGP